jgi:REP element-mobilizing transposase RayT
MWNYTDIPLAYLITFRCYGTWLHGDERGSVDKFNNEYNSPYIAANDTWKRHNYQNLKGNVVTLNAQQRKIVKLSIEETAHWRKWQLHYVNVRTNHVHIVVSIGTTNLSIALNAFKANATRKLKEENCWNNENSPWARRGSKRNLWNEDSIGEAVNYIMNEQGENLPDFD